MANPKRKHSSSRKGKRRSHHGLKVPSLSLCANCGNPKPPHRACPECGYYKGRQVIEGTEE